MQSRRLDEQRASLPRLPGLNYLPGSNAPHFNNNNNTIPPGQGLHRPSVDASAMPDDDFFEMLMRCQVCIVLYLISLQSGIVNANNKTCFLSITFLI